VLTPEEIDAITKHEVAHKIAYCSCPCFDALLRLGKQAQAIKKVEKSLLDRVLDADDDEVTL
jgi:hypothetical protein